MKVKSKRLKKLETRFLSPTGEFYPCGWGDHIALGTEILKILCPNEYFSDPEEALRKRGWVDIHMDSRTRKFNVCMDYHSHLSPEQVRALKPLVEENENEIEEYKIDFLRREFER